MNRLEKYEEKITLYHTFAIHQETLSEKIGFALLPATHHRDFHNRNSPVPAEHLNPMWLAAYFKDGGCELATFILTKLQKYQVVSAILFYTNLFSEYIFHLSDILHIYSKYPRNWEAQSVTVTSYRLDNQGWIPSRGREGIVSSPLHADWSWGLPSLLPNGYWGLPQGQSCWGMKLNTYLHLELRLRMQGAIPTLPNTPSWSGAQLKKHGDNFTFTLP